ncbi:adhesion G-protein coupled receptor G4 [Nycticebus coucang]|uniref:adhesion G-protein coupled receptor G4 n=1 Tax=Nycticebus coucang TaxID=9470 RepID=UPI00234CE06F|nr:adhesion G-protein coupled receptor G4 [Nycticebus coucang]
MKEHIIFQRLYGLILLSSFIFLSDMLSLKGKRLDFYERVDTYVSVNTTIPELSRFTACIDLTFMDDNSSYWMAFSYITNNTLLKRENIHLGLAGDHQQLIVHNLGKTFYIHYRLTPFQWHTVCSIWDGVKGRLEIFLNKKRILVVMDQPQNLTSNGMLALGNLLKNGDSQDKNVPSFPGSLYYFQLWDHILESEEFMKCLDGNVVSWKEDVWLVNKIIPTVDRRLRCLVSENVTIQETNTTLSPQIDMTTPTRITGLEPQNTANSSTMLPKSMPIFATDYTTLSCSHTSPPLETATAPEIFKTFVAETATFAADVLSTSASVTLPIQSTSTDITTNSMKLTNSPSLESTRTTKMAEGKATDSFHPATDTKFLSTFGLTKNPIAPKTSAIESQSAIKMTTSLFSTIVSTSMSTTSWPTHKSTDIGTLPISTAGQEFLTSTAAETVPWSTVEETSATTAHIGTASAYPPEPGPISTAAPEDSVFPRNQTTSTLATTDVETAYTVHSVTLPNRPMETTSALRTAETEMTSTKFQDVFSPRVEDSLSTSMPKDTSSMSLSFITSFPFTETQSVQTVIDGEPTHTALTSRITYTPIKAETTLSPTITGPVHTQNTPTAGEPMHTLISTRSASKSKVSESVPTSEAGYLFSTNETTWTSRPDQGLLTSMNTTTTLTFVPNETITSAFHGSNTQWSSTTTNIITSPEAAIASEATTTINVTTASYTAPLSNLTPPWFANFSTVSGITSVTNLPEFKLTTLLLKTIPMSTVAVNELHTMPRETAISPVDTISTLVDMKPNFSTEESAYGTTQIQTNTNSTMAFGDPTVSVPKSTAMQRFNATASTTRPLETSFSAIPTDMTTMSLSDSILLSQPTAAHSSATLMPVTRMFSVPVNVSTVVSEETEGTMFEPSTLARVFSTSVLTDMSNLSSTTVTTALLPPLDQTVSMTSDTMPTHRDSIRTTLETTVISFRMTPTAVPSLTETPLASLKTPNPVTAKAETMPPSTSVDRVTPSTHSLACSKSPPINIPIASSTHVISTPSTPGATQPMSQVEKTSSYALRFPYTFSASGDVVSVATGTTETLVVDETVLSHTSAHEFTTSIDGHISQSVTGLVNTPISSQLVTGTSISSSDKDQMTTSLAKTPSTMKVTETFPPENSFISYSQSTSPLEMTDTGFSETTKISNHQTHSPSEIPLRTTPDENSASSSTSRNTQTTPTLTSHNTEDFHFSEMYTNIGKTALPSQALSITTFLPPEKESMNDLSLYTPRTVEMRVSSTSVTHPVSYRWDTSFADTTTSKTTRTSNPVNINTTLSHLPSLRTQPEVTSVASSISESTQTFPEFASLSTVGLYNASFPVISTDRITTPLFVSNVPTTLLRETSMATSMPIHHMSSLPVNITAFTSKNVPEIPTLLITKSSKTTHPDSLKSPSLAASGSMSEMPSMSVNDSAFSSAPVSSDISTIAGSFSTLLSSITPRTSMITQIATLDITPMTYTEPTSKSTMVSSALTTSEMIEVSLRITPPSSSSPPEPTFSSVKPIPTTIMAGAVTPFVSATPPYPHISKNTEAISSIPKTAFSPFLSTTQHSSQGAETTVLGILEGLTSSSPPAISSSRMAAITNTSFRTTVPENMRSATSSDNIHTSLDIQVSPSLTSFKSTPGPIKTVKATTTYISFDTGNMTSVSENTSLTSGLTKSAKSVNTPVSYPTWIPSSGTPLSLKSFPYSLHGTETKLSTLKPSASPKSQMGFSVLATKITSSNTQSLFTTSWKTLTAKGSQFPIPTTTHRPTPIEMETETLHLVPGPLSTSSASQTGLVSRDVMAMSSVPTTGILPTYGLSGNPSLATSSRDIPTTLTDIKPTFEKTTTSVTPGTTLPSTPSGTISRSILSKATTSPTLTWILSSLPLATVSNAPHVITSSPVEVSKSTFLTSDTMPAHPFTNFTTLPFPTVSTIFTQTTPTPPMGSITTSFQTSLPMSIEITDDSIYLSTSPEASSRTSVTTNSRIVSQPPTFRGMSMSPSITKHTHSIGSMPLPRPTVSSEWNRIPTASTHPTLIFSEPTPDSLNVIATTSTASRVSFPLKFTRMTPPSTTNVSSLVSSYFETSWLDTTPSFVSTEASTSLIAAESTVSFYNTEMSFSVFDEESRILTTRVINEFTKNWLNSAFQDSEFLVANLAIQIKSRDILEEETAVDRAIFEQREGQAMTTISHVLYSCIGQVIIKANSSLGPSELISSIKNKIHGNVTHRNFTGDQLTLLVKSEHVAVKKLDPGKCEVDETASKYKGTYKWLVTNPTDTAQTRCIKNEDGTATRICSISINTGKSQWEKPRYKQCKLLQELPNKIVDLANITISDENVDDVAEHILNLINESPPLDKEETKIIISKVSDISQCDEISMNLTQIILQIISAVLEKQNESASDLHEVSNEILRIIERAGHKVEFSGSAANLMVAGLALSVLRVDHTFEGMTFSIRSYKEGTDPEIYLGDVPLGRTLASIYLPKSLMKTIPLNNLQTILFSFFGQTSLFKTKNFTKALTTYVVSASISDMSIQNLADPVVITLQHIQGNQNYDQVHCAFWDFENNNGLGGWTSSGCKVKETNINHTICQCDHLTHFGVLMDLSRSAVDAVNERILVLITYTGCGISSIFLGIAMVTYIAFHKLRKDCPSKILINLCTALLMLNLVFLVNSWLSSFQKVGLCITVAVALHYFLLVSLTWMGLEAVHMYFALVKVFNIYIPNYILKFCLVGWGMPAIMVAIIVSVKKDLYGTMNPTTPFCWIKDDSIFYISVVAYFCLIFLMNFSMFCTVLAQVNSMKSHSQRTWWKMILHDLKGTMSLTFLLGLTWGFAFFAWGPVRVFFLYLFAIFNTLQGFLIFVFHCVMKKSVREQWQMHLCCGWLRLDNSSDGSSWCGINIGYKQEGLKKTFEHKLLTPSLKSTATNSTFKSLGCAQGIPSEISFPHEFSYAATTCKVPDATAENVLYSFNGDDLDEAPYYSLP